MKIEPDVRIVLMHRTCAEEGAMSFKYKNNKEVSTCVLVFRQHDRYILVNENRVILKNTSITFT